MARHANLNKTVDNLLIFEQQRHENPGLIWGVPTGIERLDRLTGGLHKGQVSILGARPSVGKSSLMIQFLIGYAQKLAQSHDQGERVGKAALFSPEMTEDQVVFKMAANLSNTVPIDIFQGRATEAQRQAFRSALETVRSLQDKMDIMAGPAELYDIQQYMETKDPGDVEILIIDYIQRLHIRGSVSFEDQSMISTTIKDIANNANIPVLALSQFSRDVEKRAGRNSDEMPRPKLSDFRGTGRLEEDADIGMLLHQPRPHHGDNPWEVVPTTVIVEKNRFGPTDDVHLRFIPGPGRFEEPRTVWEG